MALRNVRLLGDEILRKKSRTVNEVNDRLLTLLDDMAETMYHENGVGLAGPQVGILKKVIVVDTGEGLYKLINPEIIYKEGKDIDVEGCLSIPGTQGSVERPYKVKVKALNEKGEEVIVSGEGLMARALCHEIDHLYGILFIDKTINKEE